MQSHFDFEPQFLPNRVERKARQIYESRFLVAYRAKELPLILPYIFLISLNTPITLNG